MIDHSAAPQSPVPMEHWHTLSGEAVQQRWQTGPNGLGETEARRRLQQYGANRLAAPKRRSALLRLLMQFHNILLYVMLGAAVITAFLGHWIDTGVLFAAVVINAIIGFLQEGKAEAALDAIRAMLSPHATVIRDGQSIETMEREDVTEDRMVTSMVGRTLENRYPHRTPNIGETIFELKNWSVHHPVHPER